MQRLLIHVYGDSHSCVFSGKDEIHGDTWSASILDIQGYQFSSKRLGPLTAYKIKEKNLDPGLQPGQTVMFSFGEIDCRMFLNTKKNIKETVDRYFEYIERQSENYKTWVLCPPASALSDFLSIGHPTNGSCKERNLITREFINLLKEKCLSKEIKTISIFEDLIDSDTMLTKMEYYWDDFHLGQKSIPLFEKEFNKYKEGI
jgi:hypothetical protein